MPPAALPLPLLRVSTPSFAPGQTAPGESTESRGASPGLPKGEMLLSCAKHEVSALGRSPQVLSPKALGQSRDTTNMSIPLANGNGHHPRPPAIQPPAVFAQPKDPGKRSRIYHSARLKLTLAVHSFAHLVRRAQTIAHGGRDQPIVLMAHLCSVFKKLPSASPGQPTNHVMSLNSVAAVRTGYSRGHQTRFSPRSSYTSMKELFHATMRLLYLSRE